MRTRWKEGSYMPRYFFDMIEPQGMYRDDIGTECANHSELRAVTLRTICEIAAEVCWQSEPLQYGIIVRDADDREVYAVNLNLVEHRKRAA